LDEVLLYYAHKKHILELKRKHLRVYFDEEKKKGEKKKSLRIEVNVKALKWCGFDRELIRVRRSNKVIKNCITFLSKYFKEIEIEIDLHVLH